jgi:transposase
MTKRVKRRFTPEFRAEVVKLVTEGGKSSSQVARDHSLGAGLVAHWVKQAKIDTGEGPSLSLTSAEREELSRARKDLRELRRENDFLKKTAVWFASQSL